MPATRTLQSITPDAPDLNGCGRGHGPLHTSERASAGQSGEAGIVIGDEGDEDAKPKKK